MYGQLPSEKDLADAWEKFNTELNEYTNELREWLEQYREASWKRFEHFAVTLVIANEVGGEHAEGIEIVLSLPESVEASDVDASILTPPEAPVFRRPAFSPHGLSGLMPDLVTGRGNFADYKWSDPRLSTLEALSPKRRDPVRWDEARKEAQISIESIYMGRHAKLKTMHFRAVGPGEHRIKCTIYSKTLTEPHQAMIDLVVPPRGSDRPAFGRLAGILEFPDIDLTDDAGEIQEKARTRQPPLTPPAPRSDDGDALRKLGDFVALSSWNALGLDPNGDLGASDAKVVRVEKPDA